MSAGFEGLCYAFDEQEGNIDLGFAQAHYEVDASAFVLRGRLNYHFGKKTGAKDDAKGLPREPFVPSRDQPDRLSALLGASSRNASGHIPAVIFLMAAAVALTGVVASIRVTGLIHDRRLADLSATQYTAMHQMRDKTFRRVMPMIGLGTIAADRRVEGGANQTAAAKAAEDQARVDAAREKVGPGGIEVGERGERHQHCPEHLKLGTACQPPWLEVDVSGQEHACQPARGDGVSASLT